MSRSYGYFAFTRKTLLKEQQNIICEIRVEVDAYIL